MQFWLQQLSELSECIHSEPNVSRASWPNSATPPLGHYSVRVMRTYTFPYTSHSRVSISHDVTGVMRRQSRNLGRHTPRRPMKMGNEFQNGRPQASLSLSHTHTHNSDTTTTTTTKRRRTPKTQKPQQNKIGKCTKLTHTLTHTYNNSERVGVR